MQSRQSETQLGSGRRALAELQRLWSATDVESAELRARHVRGMLATTPWSMTATLLNVLLCVWVLHTRVPLMPLLAWAGALSLVTAAATLGWWRLRHRVLLEARPRLVRRATLYALLMGGLWGLMPLLWFPKAEPGLQLLIAVLVTGLSCAGSLALSMVPTAAMAYAGAILVASVTALALDGGPLSAMVMALMSLYCLTLGVAVLAMSRLFTQRLESEREATRQTEVVGLLLRDFEESTADVLWEIDRQGRFLHATERLAAMLERPAARLPQLGMLSVLATLQQEGSGGVARLKAAMDRGEAFRDQVVRVTSAQGPRWWSITAKPVFDDNGLPNGWRGVLSDVTSERQSHQHLAFLAHYDSLTGLANRVSVRNRLAQAVETVPGKPRLSALLCLDLDNFKAINDAHGHSVGDGVLQEIARRLRKQMRKADLCGRLGGDEFAVVLDDLRSEQEAMAFAERLVQSMRVPCEVQGMALTTGVSVGLAFLPQHAQSVDEALVAADLALYEAKSAGRSRVSVFSPELGASKRRRLSMERELREALLREQFQVVYQPQVDIASWRIVGAEALLRWQHPTLGLVSPAEFIPLAEDSGLINNIGAWVLARACADATGALAGLRIAVNASAVQLQRSGFVRELEHLVSSHQVPAGVLEVEVTESLLMENVSSALENLHAIKKLGVRVALDDFGTGYSSLAYLRRFPFDKLKIDRAFIRELITTADARAIVRTIIHLAGILGMDTVAEGVEEPAQLEVLARNGCAAIQGFLVARPMTAGQLAELVRDWVPQRTAVQGEDLPDSVAAALGSSLAR